MVSQTPTFLAIMQRNHQSRISRLAACCRSSKWLLLFLFGFGMTHSATAQVLFQEDFESLSPYVPGQLGPQSLEQQGWIFRNQSGPTGGEFTWRKGPYNPSGCGVPTFGAQSGSGFLGSDWRSFSGGPGVSNWAILPVVSGQTVGSQIGVHVRQQILTGNTRIEVRYSPTGGTQTGSTSTDVGDFTQLLIEAAPPNNSAWQYLTAPIPGSGRLALRYYIDGNFGNCVYIGGVDEVAVSLGGGPCSGYPLVPQPGQAVSWTAAASPHRICASLEIPVGASVIVESGASVLVEAGSELTVNGQLIMRPGSALDTPFMGDVMVTGEALLLGSPSNPIVLTGDPGGRGIFGPDRISALPGGLVRMEHVTLETTVNAFGTGAVVATDVVSSGMNNGFYASSEQGRRGGHLVLKDCTFLSDASVDNIHAYLKIDDCTFDNTTLRIHRGYGAQDLYLDGITAQNHGSDACLQLSGGNFQLGPNNVLQNNVYPVTLNGGGLLDGSVLPTSGNTNNQVHVSIPGAEGNIRFGSLAIPYRVDASSTATVARRIDVSPGARLQMAPGAVFRAWFGSILNLEGTPEIPILFEPAQIGGSWEGLKYALATPESRVEYVEFRGAMRAIQNQQGWLDFDNNLFSANSVGLFVGQSGTTSGRGNRFFGNGTGVHSGIPLVFAGSRLNGDGNPNWFEGNSIGMTTVHDGSPDTATGNYWGDPSGPQHPSNPGGAGEVVMGDNTVVPFETAQPTPNHPPVVRLQKHARLFEEGSKVWLTWEASDDDTISHFQILHAPHGVSSGLTPIATNIPSSARSWEITVPSSAPSNLIDYGVLRVEAYDSHGQMGWDQIEIETPRLNGFVGGFLPDAFAGVTLVGTEFEICGQYFGMANPNHGYEAWIAFDGDGQLFPLGAGGPSTPCSGFTWNMPAFSTDTARILTVHGSQRSYEFSDYFEVRPNPVVGDTPPLVALVSPFPPMISSGTNLPIRWAAIDDEGLRSFDIQATYNGGRTWHTVVSDLDGTARAYDWLLPPSAGLEEFAVRVIARDVRFQNSSATSSFASVEAPLGHSLCEPVPNSTGTIGRIAALTSLSTSANDFGLGAWDLPPGLAAYFLNGSAGATAVQPAGSMGNLCLGGTLGRFNLPGQFGLVTPEGTLALDVNLTAIPTAAGPMMVQAGQTWYFTAWYRDVFGGLQTSNFTDVVAVTFLP